MKTIPVILVGAIALASCSNAPRTSSEFCANIDQKDRLQLEDGSYSLETSSITTKYGVFETDMAYDEISVGQAYCFDTENGAVVDIYKVLGG